MSNENKEKIIISIISNIIIEPILKPLIKEVFKTNKKLIEINIIDYNQYETLENQKCLLTSDIIIIWINFEEFFYNNSIKRINELIFFEQIYFAISNNISALKLWFLFEYYNTPLTIPLGHTYNNEVDKLNSKIIDAFGDICFIDLKSLIAKVGSKKAYDLKGKYRWNAPYSKALIEIAVNEIYKQYLIEMGITKKCLVLDCDNVLWGGILSEDGIENLKLSNIGIGRIHKDFQYFVRSLYYHGVILTISSKNDLSDVISMFREHSEMVLKEEHIACFKVNWNNKPDNIKQIAETLNIGLNSIVFIDDSPIEIEGVKAMLPDVTTILFEKDTIYEKFSFFNLKSSISISDIEKRNKTYQTNQSREILKSQYNSYNDFIKALEVKIDIQKAVLMEFSRISELSQRTNKCTNGKRYTISEIKKNANIDNISLYSLSVSDRFSDLGIVGAFEIEGNVLTLFSLSCRTLGRQVEEKALSFIAKNYQIKKINFYSTGVNEGIKVLLLKAFPNAVIWDCENIQKNDFNLFF